MNDSCYKMAANVFRSIYWILPSHLLLEKLVKYFLPKISMYNNYPRIANNAVLL